MSKKSYSKVLKVLTILVIASLFILPLTSSKYIKNIPGQVTLNINEPRYIIRFDSNGGIGTMEDQTFVYSQAQELTSNTFTKDASSFLKWNTEADGSGTDYEDGASLVRLSSENGKVITLYAQWQSGVARIGNTMYQTLQAAIDAVPTDDTQTTVELLADVSENLTVAAGKNIKFVLSDHTISVDYDPVFELFGKVEINDGTVLTSGSNTAAINVNTGAVLNVNGGRIIDTAINGKQAIYNLGGEVYITGGYMENACIADAAGNNKRGAVHNKVGTMVITGGTIVAKSFIGVQNEADLIIGVQDNIFDPSTPVIQGGDYGLTNTIKSTGNNVPTSPTHTCYFYNGIIKGKAISIDDESLITGKETGSVIAHTGETIDGTTYVAAYLATDVKTVTFNPNGGRVTETSRNVETNHTIGSLPVPTKDTGTFEGWFTQQNGGTQITPDTVITSNMTIYAHWKEDVVCIMNGVEYTSLKTAIQNAQNNTQTTITMLKDISIVSSNKIAINGNKNIILDMDGHTMSFGGGAQTPLIENSGTLEIRGGTLTSSSTQGIVNNKNGTLTVNGTNIAATGTRQAIYAEKGTVNITGGAVLSATSTERATVQCLGPATVNIIDATITSENYDAVVNVGTLNIGTSGDSINTSTPTIIGKGRGVNNTGTFNFYDGTLKGITGAMNGTPNNIEQNSTVVTGTESIDGVTYITAYLVEN